MPTKTQRKRFQWPSNEAASFQLPGDQRKALCKYLNLTSEGEAGRAMLGEVEQILAEWRHFYKAIANQPRPAHVREALKEIKNKADSLFELLNSIDADTGALLRGSHAGHVGRALYGDPPRKIPYSSPIPISYRPEKLLPALEQLCNGCARLLDDLRGTNSRHAPRTAATTRAARDKLGQVFDRYTTADTKRNRSAFIDLARPKQ